MQTRREFLAASAVAGMAAWTRQAAAKSGGQRLYIGTANTARDGSGVGPGIFHATFEDGRLSQPQMVAKLDNPGFLATAKGSDLLFAQASAPGHSVAVNFRKMDDGNLREVSRALSDGGGGCFIGITRDGRAAFVANYGSGSVSSFLADAAGKLSQASFVQFPPDGHGPDTARQEKSHPHSAVVSPDGDFVFVNDLGLDCIHVFRLERTTAKLLPHRPDRWQAAPGSGPRHLLLHPNGKWVYNINEMGATINQLQWNPTHGVLTTKGTWSTMTHPLHGKDQVRACEMCFSRDFRFLYAANRIHESFAVFSVDAETGGLTLVQERANPGTESRHIAVDPTGRWFLSANQFSGDISVFPLDVSTGKMGERTGMVQIAGPSCLLFD